MKTQWAVTLMFIVCLLAICLPVSPVVAEDQKSTTLQSLQSMPPALPLTPGGRIDPEATREAGFEGSLDSDGFNVRLNDQTLLYGDGSDGDATFIPGTYDFHREYNFQNLTVNSGAIIVTHGNIIRVAGTLLNNGTILDYGAFNGFGGMPGNGGHLTIIPPFIVYAGDGAPGIGRGGAAAAAADLFIPWI